MVDQLDMLYHDIKNGNLENGSWIQAIDEVKNKYPKPDWYDKLILCTLFFHKHIFITLPSQM